MGEIIRGGLRVRRPDWVAHHFEHRDGSGAGYAFELDPVSGELLMKAHVAIMARVAADPAYRDAGVQVIPQGSYWEPAVLRCVCGREVTLYSDTNDCECGRCWNGSGQMLNAHAAHCYVCGELGGDCGRGEW